MHKETQKTYEIKIKVKHFEYQVGTCAASPWLDGVSRFLFGWSVSICILWLLSLVTLPLLNVIVMWMRGLWNMYQGKGGRRWLCMTWVGRHELNVGCLKARGGYNCLGGAIGQGHGWVVVNGGSVRGGLEFSMGKPRGRSGVNGRDGWHGRLGCVLRGGHGWNRGLSGQRRGGGRLMTCHWSSWARTGPYI